MTLVPAARFENIKNHNSWRTDDASCENSWMGCFALDQNRHTSSPLCAAQIKPMPVQQPHVLPGRRKAAGSRLQARAEISDRGPTFHMPRSSRRIPLPFANFGHVLPVLADVVVMLLELAVHQLF